jgi:hypothetical protein
LRLAFDATPLLLCRPCLRVAAIHRVAPVEPFDDPAQMFVQSPGGLRHLARLRIALNESGARLALRALRR